MQKDDKGKERSEVVASRSITTDGDGSFPVTVVWSSPLYKITTAEGTIYRLRDYEYEIWVGDISHAFIVRYPESRDSSAPEFVVPEPGTVILMLAMFGALATAYLTRKRLHY